jgi:hypothetical protein
LHGDAVRVRVRAPEAGRHDAAGTERAVERARSVVADDREVAGAPILRVARRDDLAVRLQRHGVGARGSRTDRRRDEPADAERRVERAVGFVPCDGETREARGAGPTGDDDLVVGLQHHTLGLCRRRDRRRDDAPGAEPRIEGAVGLVADDDERVVRRVGAGRADDDDLAVGLDGDARCTRPRLDRRRDDPARTERRVERAVRFVARHRERGRCTGLAGGDQLAVRL